MVAEKLLKARLGFKAVPLTTGKELKYAYAGIANVKKSVKDALDSCGLAMTHGVHKCRFKFTSVAGYKAPFMTCTIQGTITLYDPDLKPEDPGYSISEPFCGVGTDWGTEKAYGKAVTYGIKSWYLHTFLIASDEDDPDHEQKLPEPEKEARAPQSSRAARPAASPTGGTAAPSAPPPVSHPLRPEELMEKRRAWYGTPPTPWAPPPGFLVEGETDPLVAATRHVDELVVAKRITPAQGQVIMDELDKLAKVPPARFTYQYLVFLQHLANPKWTPGTEEQAKRLGNLVSVIPQDEMKRLIETTTGAVHYRMLSHADMEIVIEAAAKLAAGRAK